MISPPAPSAPRLYADMPLESGLCVPLPAMAARHVQVLRMQPGQTVSLFNGRGGQWRACITQMGRQQVEVLLQEHTPIEREAQVQVTLLVGIPANERMDFLVEKATELGAAAIYPLLFERSVIKLNAERSSKKVAHWQAVAVAACEQCGRNRIPLIHPVTTLPQLLQTQISDLPSDRRVLSLLNAAAWTASPANTAVCILSGPEGGLTPQEEQQLVSLAQFQPYSLGPRTLRADTAPLAALSTLVI